MRLLFAAKKQAFIQLCNPKGTLFMSGFIKNSTRFMPEVYGDRQIAKFFP